MIMINTTPNVLIKCTKYRVLISNMSLNQVHHRLPFRCFCSILHIVKGRNYQKQFLYCKFFQKTKWYFVIKIVLTYCEKKCSPDREKLLKLEAEGQEFTKFLRLLEQFIQAVKGQNNWKK